MRNLITDLQHCYGQARHLASRFKQLALRAHAGHPPNARQIEATQNDVDALNRAFYQLKLEIEAPGSPLTSAEPASRPQTGTRGPWQPPLEIS
jgi:hypothetical protein